MSSACPLEASIGPRSMIRSAAAGLIASLLSLSIVLLLSAGTVQAAAKDDRSRPEFAQALFEEGDYYRAIGEYKRFLFQSPGTPLRHEILYRIGVCYLRGERFSEALKSFDDLLATDAPDLWKEKSEIKIGDVHYSAGEFDLALDQWGRFLLQHPGSAHASRVRYMSGWAEVKRSGFTAARELFRAAAADPSAAVDLRASATKVVDRIGSSLPLPTRSPWIAGSASALVPGLGQFYCGRTGDAVSAFLVTGGLAWLTVEAVRREDGPQTALWGTLTAMFYGGNIYGAVMSAGRFDRREEDRFKAELGSFRLISVEGAF